MSLNNIWQINDTAFSDRNLSGVQRQRITQSADTLTFTQSEAYDADPEFEYGQTVTVKRDGAQWFKGICTGIARRGSGTSERINYTISGPWWQLENVIYRQQFTRYIGGVPASTTLAKLILGTDETGARLDSGEVITAVVNYAIAQLGVSAILQLGTVEASTQMPYEELKALSCAEVISRVLRWNPDIVAYFDYSTTTPTLHFKKRSSLPAREFAHADVLITEANINPRHDLQKDGVVIQYERIDTIGDSEKTVVITDSSGSTTDETKTLYLFFDLQGSSTQILSQQVVTSTFQISSADWWQKRHPKLKGATGISISNSSKEAVDDDGDGPNDGTSYTKELMSGNIATWMGGVGINDQIIKADVTYTPSGGSSKTETLRMVRRGTNANSQTYNTTGSSSPGEPTPEGLAASILSSLHTLQYEGSLAITQSDVTAENLLAIKLNIAGGRSEWASMGAQIYSVVDSLDAGTTTLKFGPAKHLGANDLFQLLRNVRTRQGALATARLGGSAGSDQLPNHSPSTYIADDGGSGAETPPLNAYWTDKAAGKLKIKPGTVDGVEVTGTDTEITNTNAWLNVTLSQESGPVSSASVVFAQPTASTTVGWRKIYTVTGTAPDQTIHNFLAGSQDHDSCGTDHSFILS